MNELGLVLVGLIIGVIIGIFMAAIMNASSVEDPYEDYQIKRIVKKAYHDGLIMYDPNDIEIIDKTNDNRYLIRIKRRR